MRRARRKLIKICGLTTEQDVRYASTFLPDLAGFVLFFPKSKRNLEIDRAIKLKESLDKNGKKCGGGGLSLSGTGGDNSDGRI